MITINTVCMGAVRLKKTKMLGCAVAIALATTVGITSDVYAEEYDPSVAITATALPVEESEEAVAEEKKAPTMQDKIAAIMNESKGQEQSGEAVYAANGVKKGNLYIPKDTVVTLSLVDPLHSKKVKKNTTFRLETVDDLVVNGVVIIPKGREVVGKVLEARGSRAMGGSGKLELNIPYIETLNGVQIPVDGYITGRGGSDGGAGVVFAVVSMAGGLFMKGKNVEYVQGQLFNVTVNKDTDLEATPDNLEEVMSVDRTRTQSITVSVAE